MSLANAGVGSAVAARLRNSIINDAVMHAYIFESDLRIDKHRLAKEFAKAVLCKNAKGDGCDACETCRRIDHDNYSDMLYAELSENGTVRDEAVAKLQERLKNKPLEGDCNIAVIDSADTMTARAQNRILKTLEEPAGNAVILLLSENAENLLPTIRSRCVIYRINDYNEAPEGEMAAEAEEAADMLLAGRPFYAFSEKLERLTADKRTANAFLDALEFTYRNLLIERSEKSRLYKKEYIYDCVRAIEQAKRSVAANINVGYVIKSLIIEIGG